MDSFNLIGYFVAALAIALGLYLILRKNVDNDSQTEQIDAENFDAEDLEELALFDDKSGRIPVVPRHVREQLVSQTESIAQDSGHNNHNGSSDIHSNQSNYTDDDLLEEASHIKPASARELLDDEPETEYESQLSEIEPNEVLVSQGSHLVDSTRPDQEPAEDMFDQALAQLEAATAPENNLDSHASSRSDQHLAHQPNNAQQMTEQNIVDAEAFDMDKQTANVEDWDGESALLDAHIEDQARRDDESALAQAEHIVALYVMPAASRALSGERTMQLLRKYGLRYGEMSLFHRFLESDGTGPLMFSVLRYTNEGPQGFDLEALPNEQVEGLAFFLALPSKRASEGYDMMVSISTLLAREIQGLVYDEYMNELTPQLREHYRHFVLEYRLPD